MTRTLFALFLASVLALAIACGDDDDDSPVPFDGSDDDDSGDDDDSDVPPAVDPYEGFAASGKRLGETLGISSHMSRSTGPNDQRDLEIAALAAAGVSIVRNDFKWEIMEAEDDQWYFDGYDEMIELCADAGMSVDAILDFDVEWAAPGGVDDLIDPADWADFVGHAAAHFADTVDLYEIWNEENTTRFWQPEPNPKKYGDLLKASHEAIHANDPTAAVMFGGLSPMDSHILDPRGPYNFLYRVYREHPDICDAFDIMAIHPYTFIQHSAPETAVDLVVLKYPNLVGAIESVRKILDEIGCPDKPIHMTEMGWPDVILGRERQGAFLTRGILLSLSAAVDGFYWYTFWDGAPEGEYATEDSFGLFPWPRDGENPKPSYVSLAALNDLLGEARYAGDLGATLGWEEPRHALAFVDDDGTWTVAAWHAEFALHEEYPATIPIPPDATGTWTMFSQTGDVITEGDVDDGPIEMVLLGWVHYLRFETAPESR